MGYDFESKLRLKKQSATQAARAAQSSVEEEIGLGTRNSERRRSLAEPANFSSDDIMHLQKTIGNQAVMRLMGHESANASPKVSGVPEIQLERFKSRVTARDYLRMSSKGGGKRSATWSSNKTTRLAAGTNIEVDDGLISQKRKTYICRTFARKCCKSSLRVNNPEIELLWPLVNK